jgi:Ca2+-binding RTX toxin-like protein
MQAPKIWSGPTLVNTQTVGNQGAGGSGITVLANGGYVVTWSHQTSPPINSDKTYFQIFDVSGNKVGGETLADTPANSYNPQVTALTGGGFVITQYANNGNTWDVFAQVFDDEGNSPTAMGFKAVAEDDNNAKEDQNTPRTVALSNGGFAIAYFVEESGGGRSLRVQLFNADGSSNGAQIPVTNDPASMLASLSIEPAGDGLFVVTWQDGVYMDNDVKMQIFNNDGTPHTAIIPVTSGADSYTVPSVAQDGLGNLIVTYCLYSTVETVAQIYSADGTLIKAQFPVGDASQNGPTSQDAKVIGLPSGGFLVVWREWDGSNTTNLIGQTIDADGNKIGPETLIYAHQQMGDNFRPSDLAVMNDGRVIVTVWGHVGTGPDTDGDSMMTFILDVRGGIIDGTEGDDTLLGSHDATADTITAKGGNDELYGLDGDDTMYGNAGNDSFDGGAGADSLVGGSGDDYYFVDAADTIVESVGGGTDTVYVEGFDYTLAGGAAIEVLEVGGDTSNDITGNEFGQLLKGDASSNKLMGMGGNDTLDGGGDVDYMDGGQGDDVFYVDDETEVIVEALNGGTDTVITKDISFSLQTWDNVENLTLGGTSGSNAVGNGLANLLTGNGNDNRLFGLGGNDTLIGGGGADTMLGGDGNDTYEVTDSGDDVQESPGQGIDTVKASINYTLTAEVENLTLTGPAIAGTGNALANAITGNAAGNSLTGLDGNDTLNGQGGNDTMAGGKNNDTYYVGQAGDVVTELFNEGTDTVIASLNYTLGDNVEKLTLAAGANATGNGLANTITGNAGANVIDGKAGADTMTGLAGDDTYVVTDAGDVVVEAANGGTDSVVAYLDHTLADNVENLTLAAGINATGNALANAIIGNTGANVIDGKAGADTMTGLAGDDTYVVTDAGDVVVEAVNGGTDTVIAHLDYALTASVENLTLAAGTNAIGNSLANAITGNAGNNTLDGQAGADTMTGGLGNDDYIVADAGDVVVEAANGGIDTVHAAFDYTLGANLESLVLTGPAAKGSGNDAANALFGNGLANTLNGGKGNDTMEGGSGKDAIEGGKGRDLLRGQAGADQLWGGGGKDTFDFDAVSDIKKASGKRDVIKDLQHGKDKIDLSTIDAKSGVDGNQKFKFISAEGRPFTGVAGQLIWDQKDAAGKSHDVTLISGDTNGDGVADFTLELSGLVNLTKGDFIL